MSTIQNVATKIKSRVSNIRENVAGKMGVKKQNDVHILNGQLVEKGKQLLSEFRSRDKPMKKLSLTTGERMGLDFGDSRSPKAVVQNKILDIMT
ncbi:MAG TPA: hypothetical protein VMZ29_09270 [Candidatus Bathyarchaeia archaeon]|nr:hypothetical protein [Candidatus Bathyarchaeia archaeon]